MFSFSDDVRRWIIGAGGEILSSDNFEWMAFSQYGMQSIGLPSHGSYLNGFNVCSNEPEARLFLSKIQTSILAANQRFVVRIPKHLVDDDFILELGGGQLDLQHVATAVIDVRIGESEIFSNFKGRARTAVRKAISQDIVCDVIASDAVDIDEFFDFYSRVFSFRTKAVMRNKLFFRNLFRSCVDLLHVQRFSAANGNPLGYQVFSLLDDRMTYMVGAIDHILCKNMGLVSPANLGIFEAIKSGYRGSKIEVFDLGGLGISRIDRFKESFGGKQVDELRLTKHGLLTGFASKFGI